MALEYSGHEDDNDDQVSAEFDEKFGRPELKKNNLSYKVVGRLSKWEGGESSPYSTKNVTGKYEDDNDAEKMTIKEFLWQFIHPTYDMTEVTIEDVERVKLMHDRFLGEAQFSFNYTTLLVIASVIAGVGLGMNSVASIIASMLISPLMGPVTAIAYGIAIGDFKMVRMAVITEFTSLATCIAIGTLVAICMFPTPFAQENWPTDEMTGRGTMANFYAGIPIAFFSGLGVAVGLLDSQTNSLVGVAISASLLPPAVNAGMLWVIAALKMFEDVNKDWRNDGTISLFLTIMNIGVIIVASMFMFRLKETLPIEKSIFWTDLGVARKIYHNVAIIPKYQSAPSDSEIEKRVLRFFPRCSEMGKLRPSLMKNSRNLNVVFSHDDDDDDGSSSNFNDSGFKSGDFLTSSLKGPALPRISE